MRALRRLSLLVVTVALSVGCVRDRASDGESPHEVVDGNSARSDDARHGDPPAWGARAGDARPWRDETGRAGDGGTRETGASDANDDDAQPAFDAHAHDGEGPTPEAGGGRDAGTTAKEASAPHEEDASAGTPTDAAESSDRNAPDAREGIDARGTASAASLWASTALPAFDAATVVHVKSVRAKGAQLGNRQDVFARCGDSITEAPSFLVPVGLGAYQLDAYMALEPTIAAYRASALPGGSNSFTHSSQCAVGGWTTTDALAPPGAIAAELEALRPAILLVLFGTNDSQKISVDQFATNLNQIADLVEAQGVVLVLSTAPPRTDYASADAVVATFSAVIKRTASARSLPLIDLHAALTPLPGQGIGGDGVHPTVEMVAGAPASGDFTSAGLQFGSNMHNLLTLQMLDRLRAIR